MVRQKHTPGTPKVPMKNTCGEVFVRRRVMASRAAASIIREPIE